MGAGRTILNGPVRRFSSKPSTSSVRTSVFASGLSATGAFAIPGIVCTGEQGVVRSSFSAKPLHIGYCVDKNVKRVTAGFGFSLFASNTRLHGAGINTARQLGHPSGESISDEFNYFPRGRGVAVPLKSDAKIVALSSGRAHSLLLDSSGLLRCWGDNTSAQCTSFLEGRQRSVTEKPIELDDVVGVHCSYDTSFAVTSTGRVFAWGRNDEGQCAAGTSTACIEDPTQIGGDAEGERIVKVAGCADTVLAITERGDLLGWGQNEYGQVLGQPDTQVSVPRWMGVSNVLDAATSSSSVLVLLKSGELLSWGIGQSTLGLGPRVRHCQKPVQLDAPLFQAHLGSKSKLVSCFAGETACYAVTSAGECFSWGDNRYGQLGLGHNKPQSFPMLVNVSKPVKSVAVSSTHTLFLCA